KTAAIISSGWDPGLFSIMRGLFGAALPCGDSYTFWGRGVSQGHSVALRSVKGVRDAIQYSVPIEEAVASVRRGERPELTTRQKHLRECYVVAEEGADRDEIAQAIKTMPDYFADYDTQVNFISYEELKANHSKMPHGGLVMRSGNTGENSHTLEFSLELESNPEFTASVLLASARAAARLAEDGVYGAKTLLDIPLYYLHADDRMTLIKELL
ncbi:MAG: diaminopimelate dehydrogenase, partial [Oscillospiraceae bacterium]|nr:diaminopimelate dehydrogenase [Oscillospiraceae bacterium]